MPTQEYNELVAAQKADEALPAFMDLVEDAFQQKHGGNQQANRVVNKTKDGIKTRTIQQVKEYFRNNIQNIHAIIYMRSPYALHAVLYILGNIQCETFLKSLSEQDVKWLHNLINKVKGYDMPDADKTDQYASNSDDGNPNEVMRKRTAEMQVALVVYWDEAYAAVKRWDKALQRLSKVKKHQAMVAKEDMWSFDRLYQELSKHYKDKNALIYAKCYKLSKCSPEQKANVESWFTVATNPENHKNEKMFMASYFDEFKEFLGIANDAKASEQTVTPTAVVEQPVAQEEVTVKEPVAQAPVQIDGMAGVKALQVLVERLIVLRDAAQQSEEQANAQFNEALTNVRSAKTSAERAQLLADATNANAALDGYAQQKEAHNADIHTAEDLLAQRAELERLLAAKDAEIAAFTKQIQEKIK